MSEELEPALTAEEWRGVGPSGVGHPPMPSTLDDITYLDDDDLPKAVAIANFSLAVDSPYKITRADIAFVDAIVRGSPQPDTATSEGRLINVGLQSLRRLSAKLAALLPPEAP